MSNFPSLEEIDEDFSSNQPTTEFQNDDFLAREKAVLGEDAEAFTSSDQPQSVDEVVSGFETSFPPLESHNELNPSGLISQPAAPYLPGQPNQLASETKQLSLEDSEPIKAWRTRQELEIQRRDELSEAKKKETREKAEKAIDDFYDNYNAKRDDSVQQTRTESKTFIEERDNSVSGGTAWDRIAKLVDTSDQGAKGNGRDKSRFKEILLSLKGDADAPGAGGY